MWMAGTCPAMTNNMMPTPPPRLLRDYNQLVDAYNRGARI
jgi:hypothetical protein